jgi:hypothetical protein
VTEGVLAVVADNGSETVYCAGIGICGGCRCRGTGESGCWCGYGRCGDGGKTARGCEGCEIEYFGEDDANIVFGGVLAIMDRTIDVEGKDGGWLIVSISAEFGRQEDIKGALLLSLLVWWNSCL